MSAARWQREAACRPRRSATTAIGAIASLVLTLALGFTANGAAAERAIVLPHGGDAGLQTLRVAAHEAVLAALGEQGFEVRPASAPEGDPAHGGGCKQIGCAPALLAAARAELAVAVAVWRSDAGPQVNVTLVDGQGNRYPAVAPVEPGGAPAAARRALLDARGLQLLGPGPWVHVEGAPAGARVVIDGAVAGALPYRGALSSGDHVLELAAPGYAAQQRELQMPLDPTATLRVEVALAPATASQSAAALSPVGGTPDRAMPADRGELPQAPPPTAADEPSVWNYVLGGVTIAGGLALATIDPLRAAARDGECVDRDCTRVYSFGGDSALKMVAGIALVGAGITVMIWQPIRVSAQVDERSAQLSVHARF